LIVEDQVFMHLKRAGAINADMMLMDTTVLESPIMYPTDVRLLYKAFGKMAAMANEGKIELWWDPTHIKQRWRAYNLNLKDRLAYLQEFSTLFVPAYARFAAHLDHVPQGPLRQRWSHLLEVLKLLEAQTQQKLAGETHIAHRVVSLDDLDARPIKKGKSYPNTEFGTTLQMTFNRQGFMITTDNFIGQPNDKTLYGPTLERFRERMQAVLRTASATPKRSPRSLWDAAPMSMRPIKRRVAKPVPPRKGLLPWPNICAASVGAFTAVSTEPPCGHGSASAPTT
jgi:hypothetical protein